MSIDEVVKGSKWIVKWYPTIWKILIPDDLFRSGVVTYWRNVWMILTGGAIGFGLCKAPSVHSGLLAWGIICAFGLIGLAFLAWLIRSFPLDDDLPLWRPFVCVTAYIWSPYLVPWGLYRVDTFINDHWDKSIERYILAPDPALTMKLGLVNSVPYFLFTLAAAFILIIDRCVDSAPSARV